MGCLKYAWCCRFHWRVNHRYLSLSDLLWLKQGNVGRNLYSNRIHLTTYKPTKMTISSWIMRSNRVSKQRLVLICLKNTLATVATSIQLVTRQSQKVIDGCEPKFCGMIDRSRANRLEMGTDPNQDPGSVFPFFHHWEIGRFRHKYELKELRINVCDMFWRVGIQIKNDVCEDLNSMGAI